MLHSLPAALKPTAGHSGERNIHSDKRILQTLSGSFINRSSYVAIADARQKLLVWTDQSLKKLLQATIAVSVCHAATLQFLNIVAQGLGCTNQRGKRKDNICSKSKVPRSPTSELHQLMQNLPPQRLQFLPETVTAYFLALSAFNSELCSIPALGIFTAVSS